LALVVLARAPAADRPVQVPFEYAKGVNSILVHARVNDKPALLILDTGSAHTVLRPELLGLPRGELQALRRSSSGAGFSGDAIGQEVSLELGGRRWPKWRVAVMDLSEILSAYPGRIDGVLGLDFFQQFRVAVVDLTGKTITFCESEMLCPSPGRRESKAVAAGRESALLSER
jgi:hypothetical protein